MEQNVSMESGGLRAADAVADAADDHGGSRHYVSSGLSWSGDKSSGALFMRQLKAYLRARNLYYVVENAPPAELKLTGSVFDGESDDEVVEEERKSVPCPSK